MIARAVSEYSADVRFVRENGEKVMASSALSILMMAAGTGTKLVIEAEGDGAEEIVDRLSEDFASGFGETE
jgi:phosphocarrier protein